MVQMLKDIFAIYFVFSSFPSLPLSPSPLPLFLLLSLYTSLLLSLYPHIFLVLVQRKKPDFKCEEKEAEETEPKSKIHRQKVVGCAAISLSGIINSWDFHTLVCFRKRYIRTK